MSLPIAGGPSRPPTPPSHQPLDLRRLMKLGVDLEDALEEEGAEVVTPELIDSIADEQGVPATHLWAAAAMTTQLPFATVEKVRFVVCVGGCQGWGALDRLDQLLDIREQRLGGGLAGFDIHAKGCLDQCGKAPSIVVHTPDGTALIQASDEKALAEAVVQACGD